MESDDPVIDIDKIERTIGRKIPSRITPKIPLDLT